MSTHEGISCDWCMKRNFRGKRFKCLICVDFDLCGSCHETCTAPAGSLHSPDHPVQCILTRSDFELYYGGESSLNSEMPQSFVCPVCGKLGFTETTLVEHVTQEHADACIESLCPICSASFKDFSTIQLTEDFVSHLTLEHRTQRETDEPQAPVRGRRAPHLAGRSSNPSRTNRRNQMQLGSSTTGPVGSIAGALASGVAAASTAAPNANVTQSQTLASFLSSSASVVGRDLSIDPIEILTHLTGTRRGLNNQSSLNSNVTVPNSAAVAAAAAAAAAGQLQQIQQIERSAEDRRTLNSLDINRDRGLTRRAGAPRSVNASAAGLSVANMIGSNGLPYLVLMDSGSHVNVSSLGNSVANSASNLPASGALLSNDHQQSSATTSAPTPATGTTVPQSSTSATQTSRLLLSSLDILNVTDEDPQKQQEQAQRVQRSVFVQELILSTLEKQFVDDLSKDKLDLGPD